MEPHTGLLEALRWRILATRRLWSREKSPSMQFLPEAPESPNDPNQPATSNDPIGYIDPPLGKLRRASVTIKGWVLFPTAATDRVDVFLDGKPLGRSRLAVSRMDVGRQVEHPLAAISGFELNADLGEWDGPDGQVTLTAEATSVDGERYLLEPVPATISSKPLKKSKLAPPPPVSTEPRGTRSRVLVFTHQLGLGGAQLYLLDLLREMARDGATSFVVVSAHDGPVREDLEAIGIPVHITSPFPMDDLASHLGRIEELAEWAEAREFDAVFINTATTLASPGAALAERLGLPVVWAIHESFPPAYLFGDLAPEVRQELERALQRSSFLVFEAEATKQLFEPIAGPARCVMLPYGLDMEPMEATRASFDQAAARRKHGIPEDARVIVCIGTVEPRKAQALLAQAFDRIAARHPHAHLYFVGGRDDDDSDALRGYIASSPHRERMELVPITPDVQPWYGMSDFFVSASDVESLPRTVLEAMVWETPVLATNVFGLPELITHGETGWLCEPRDLKALSRALDELLNTPAETRERIARQARALVEGRHSLARYGKQVKKLLEEAVAASGDAAAPTSPPQRL